MIPNDSYGYRSSIAVDLLDPAPEPPGILIQNMDQDHGCIAQVLKTPLKDKVQECW